MKYLSFWLCVVLMMGGGLILASNANAGFVIKNTAGEILRNIDAGETAAIDPRYIPIRIENTEGVAVEGLAVAMEGGSAADFSVGDLSSSTIPAFSFVTAQIKFRPQGLGSRSAVLRITSSIPSMQETTADLTGIGSLIFSPIVNDPSGVQPWGPGIAGQVYSFGAMTLNFEPLDQGITYNFAPGYLNNVPEGGIVYGSYEGVLYPYRATYLFGPPPLRRPTLKLTLAYGVAFRDFDAKLSGGGGSVAIQGDDKLIVAGYFKTVAGQRREHIVRLNPDGSVDPSFNCALNSIAECVTIDKDNKILICGYFNSVNGVAAPGIARLNQDGSLDTSFSVSEEAGFGLRIIALPDGKILYNGGTLKRLNPDGSVDQTFAQSPVDYSFNGFAVQKDGKIVANTDGLRRYHADGSVDPTFTPDARFVSAIAIQDDGKIVIGGHFSQVNGVARRRIARLNSDGTLDSSFIGVSFAEDYSPVSCVALQEDGGIMISGVFNQVDGEERLSIARLNSDGTLDKAFVAGTSRSTVTSMAIGPDGSIFVNGTFTSMGYESRTGFAKLRSRPSKVEFGVEGGHSLRWRRTGSAPALASVVFEVSTDGGSNWTHLGSPERSGDSWVLEGVALPVDGFLRAEGRSILSSRGFGLIQETKLFGRELTEIESWRAAHLGSPLNEGVGADSQDFDGDGHRNLIEYAFGLDPKVAAPAGLPSWLLGSSGYEVNFARPAGTAGITYGAEWSETLHEDDWHPAEDLSVGDTKSFRVPVGTEERKFFRLKVSNP